MNNQHDEIISDSSIDEDAEDSSTQSEGSDFVERKVVTAQGDPEVQSLVGKYQRGKLVVQSDFQRQFVWDKIKASRLMESAMLDIPLPVVYISQEQDGKEHVIDGQQRLTSFFSFINGNFPNGDSFSLYGLKVLKEYNGKKFGELPDEAQDKIRYCPIRTITFKKESAAGLKFEIFERLNTGSVSLNPQELRNCIYRGPYNDLLKELAGYDEFRSLMGLTAPDKRMTDIESVLRFAAFYHQTHFNYKSPIKRFLNREMEDNQHIAEAKATELKNAFKNAVLIVSSLLGNKAFKRFYRGDDKNKDGHWETQQFNFSLFDILMCSFAREDKGAVFNHLDAIREALIHLMTSDEEFIGSIEKSTSSQKAVTIRFDKFRAVLKDIVGVHHKEERCFSRKLKQELFGADATCAICGNAIQSIDDAAVDHIHQYWQGGKTIPENARLTHRYCNWARSRND